MTERNMVLLAIWLLGSASAWGQQEASPARAPQAAFRPSSYGSIQGRVLDSRGVAQAGVPVTVSRQDGLFIRKIYTAANGRFDLSRLAPGLYALQVSLPRFLPFSSAPIAIQAGAQVLVDVNLLALAESLEIGLPSDPAQAREDWKWALRTASRVRPILRFQEEIASRNPPTNSVSPQRPVRGTVLLLAGNESRGFGADPGVRTTFNMQYDLNGHHTAGLAGSAGWERGTPAATFRTSWTRSPENGFNSTLSATMRQLFLPSDYRHQLSMPGMNLGSRIQSFSGRYESGMPLTSSVSLRYGAIFDSIGLTRTVSQWSPFGQLTYTPSESTQWNLIYTGESPRLLPTGARGDAVVESLAIPQISSDTVNGNRPALESGKHLEAAWDRKLGSRFQLHTAAFSDSLSDVALWIAGPDQALPAGLLRDPFSTTHFLDGGNYSSAGVRASLGARLTDKSKLMVSYSYAGGLRALLNELAAEDLGAVRSVIRNLYGSSVTIAMHTVVPGIQTQVISSYKWLPQNTVAVGDPYNRSFGRAEPYLNVAFIQPIPSPDILHFQAIADFSNVLAQGYLPVYNAEGGTSYFFPSPRSFRGGFSFVF